MTTRDFPTPLAQLYYTWEELDALAALVDNDIADRYQFASGGARHVPARSSFSMLNSLRTSLREAQETIRPR